MSDDEEKKKTGLRSIRALERSGAFRSASEAMKAYETTGIGAALKAMTERNAIIHEQLQAAVAAQRPYLEMMERHRETALSISKAVEAYKASMPTLQIGSAFAGLDFGRYGKMFESLNIDQNIGSEFRAVSQRLSEQMKSIHEAALPKIELGLSTNIGDLLARSLQAQEALLQEQRAFHAEQREDAEAAKIEARFHRKMAYFSALITTLMFFWMIAHDLEERFESEEAEDAGRAELVQMREAFDNMSEQLDELRRAEEERAAREDAEAAREAEADAQLAAIMREIADGLREVDKEAGDDE